MKYINYKVSNKSSGSVTVTGRVPFTIPGNCEDMLLSLPDTDGIKATIQRFKREHPLISFVVVADEASESPDKNTGDTSDTGTDPQGNNGTGKTAVEIFAASCEVKEKAKKGEYTVVYEGKGYNVKANTPEDAIRVAYEQYSLALNKAE